MVVIAFVGKPRTGKTLHMTVMAHNDFQNNFKIFANYKLNFPSQRVNQYEMLSIPFDDVDREPKTLCIQEADKIFDSRRSMRQENVLLSSLTGQSGKRNLNIYYDTQFWNRIDQSLRAVTEFVCFSSVYVDQNREPLAFSYEMIDLFDYSVNKYTIPALMLKPYYEMYNSYETTKPLSKSNKEELENVVNE